MSKKNEQEEVIAEDVVEETVESEEEQETKTYKDVEVFDDFFPETIIHAFWNEFMFLHNHTLTNRSNFGDGNCFYHVNIKPLSGSVSAANHALPVLIMHLLRNHIPKLQNYDLHCTRVHTNLQYPCTYHGGDFHRDWDIEGEDYFKPAEGHLPISVVLMLSSSLEFGGQYEFRPMEDESEIVTVPFKRGRLVVAYDNVLHRGVAPRLPEAPARVSIALKVLGIPKNPQEEGVH